MHRHKNTPRGLAAIRCGKLNRAGLVFGSGRLRSFYYFNTLGVPLVGTTYSGMQLQTIRDALPDYLERELRIDINSGWLLGCRISCKLLLQSPISFSCSNVTKQVSRGSLCHIMEK